MEVRATFLKPQELFLFYFLHGGSLNTAKEFYLKVLLQKDKLCKQVLFFITSSVLKVCISPKLLKFISDTCRQIKSRIHHSFRVMFLLTCKQWLWVKIRQWHTPCTWSPCKLGSETHLPLHCLQLPHFGFFTLLQCPNICSGTYMKKILLVRHILHCKGRINLRSTYLRLCFLKNPSVVSE